jgi:hypothetical protein
MEYVPHVSKFCAFGVLKSHLEHDMCHPPNWATCPLLVFHHVVTNRAVQRLGTSKGKDVTGCVGLKAPKGSKVGVHINH